MTTSSRIGFTLVELLFSLAVLSIMAGVEVFLLQAGLDSWEHASARLTLQRAADKVMDHLLEGGYDDDGIRDALEVTDTSIDSISFVPLWSDYSHKPDPVGNKDQKFVLNRHFKPGGPTPIGQIKRPGSDNFQSVAIEFVYGDGREPDTLDDVMQFMDPIPILSNIKIFFSPDAETHSDVIKTFRWDPSARRMYESYAGKTRDLLGREDRVDVERCSFLYFDNLNRLISPEENGSISELNRKRVTAVKIYLVLSHKDEWRELTSFTNVRNVTTIGATITEGAEMPMPPQSEIKAFSIGDFFGLKGEGVVELVIRTSKKSESWKIRLKFKQGEKQTDLVLENFKIESPIGKAVTSAILDEVMDKGEFLSLLTIDRTGLYDYDDDEDLKDMVVITGKSAMLKVERLDFDGASMFIRP